MSTSFKIGCTVIHLFTSATVNKRSLELLRSFADGTKRKTTTQSGMATRVLSLHSSVTMFSTHTFSTSVTVAGKQQGISCLLSF